MSPAGVLHDVTGVSRACLSPRQGSAGSWGGCGAEHLTERQQARLEQAIAADERHDEVWVAYQCAQQVRAAYHQAEC